MTVDPIHAPDGDADDAYCPGDPTLDDLDPVALDELVTAMDAVVDKDSARAFYDRLAGH